MLAARPKQFLYAISLIFGGWKRCWYWAEECRRPSEISWSENGRPHLGLCCPELHFRLAVQGSSPGTRSLMLLEFNRQARKINTLLLKVESLSNWKFKKINRIKFWLFLWASKVIEDRLHSLGFSLFYRVLDSGVWMGQKHKTTGNKDFWGNQSHRLMKAGP